MRTLICFCTLVLLSQNASAGEVPEKYRPTVEKGLKWLVAQQQTDGHWSANRGNYPVPMTAMAGLALLAEGSTPSEGDYAGNIRKALDWVISESQPNGLIGNPRNPLHANRYIFGHAYAMVFLSCAYEKTEDKALRRRLGTVLNRAVRFSAVAQTTLGGYGYVSAKDGGDFSEGAATVSQILGLRAARNAGIPVPNKVLEKAREYLKKSTSSEGGIIYSLSDSGGVAHGSGRPALTAGAIPAAFGPEDYDNSLTKKWLRFCQTRIPLDSGFRRFGHDEFTHSCYAVAMYALGENGWAKLFPNEKGKEGMSWSGYRKVIFGHIQSAQTNEGAWTGMVGPVYATATYLTILQLDREELPFFAGRMKTEK